MVDCAGACSLVMCLPAAGRFAVTGGASVRPVPAGLFAARAIEQQRLQVCSRFLMSCVRRAGFVDGLGIGVEAQAVCSAPFLGWVIFAQHLRASSLPCSSRLVDGTAAVQRQIQRRKAVIGAMPVQVRCWLPRLEPPSGSRPAIAAALISQAIRCRKSSGEVSVLARAASWLDPGFETACRD